MFAQRAGFTKGNPVEHWHSIDTLNAGPVAPQTAPQNGNLSDGNAHYAPLMVRETVTVKKIWAACNAGGSGNFALGLYDASGNRLIDSGSQTHPGSATEFVYDCTDTVIGPGIYHFVVVNLNGGTNPFYVVLASPPYAHALGSYFQTGLSALPASATFAANTNGYMPIGGILTNTVVS